MFKIILGLLTLTSIQTFACNQQEAQFIGKVTHYSQIQRSESTSECYYQIQFSMLNSSEICPLVEGEVSGYQFQDIGCSLKDGDSLSGVLVRRGQWIVIE